MSSKANNIQRFQNLDYEGFRELAQDATLSAHEKIGFPNSYREGREEAIFSDIRRKLTNLEKTKQVVIDIGPGCSSLAKMFIEFCISRGHELLLVDSPEMLDLLPEYNLVTKFPAYYPDECGELIDTWKGKVDILLTYSVFHYVFAEGNVFSFFDHSLSLLAPQGQMLIGDIPNLSKRKRFFSSHKGVRFHQDYTGTQEVPIVRYGQLEQGEIDDSVLTGLISRARAMGFDGYWLPQDESLPMANRREDILIQRP
jgi:hypothetical protein